MIFFDINTVPSRRAAQFLSATVVSFLLEKTMAPSSNLLFLFLFVFLSANVFARESQFFSKVSSDTTVTTAPEVSVETAEIPTAIESKDQTEEEPSFTQDTQNDNYGLYGSENGKESSSTGLGESLFATQSSDTPFEFQTGHYQGTIPGGVPDKTTDLSDEKSRTYDSSFDEVLQHQTDDDTVVEDSLQDNVNGSVSAKGNENNFDIDFSDKKQQEDEYNLVVNSLQGFPPTSAEEKNNYSDEQQQQQQTEDNKVEDGYIPETSDFQDQDSEPSKEGMSDTRYLDNGKYYYNGKTEQRYDYNNFNNQQVTGSYSSGHYHP